MATSESQPPADDAAEDFPSGDLREENARAAALKWQHNDDERVREMFPNAEEASLYVSSRPWPALEGVLCILFTSRSGSTFLAEEIGRRYAIGKIRESFNLPIVKEGGDTPAEGMRTLVDRFREGPWFGAKAGRPGLVIAERCGFFDEYLGRTSFILLLRRDLVAQSVSMVKAKITSRFHFAQAEKSVARSGDYSYDRIAQGINIYSRGVGRIVAFARATGRPVRTLAYEDFANGDFRAVEAICGEFGIPQRVEGSPYDGRQIEKIGDSINEEWCSRFRKDMDKKTRRQLDRQAKRLDRLRNGSL